MLRLAGGPICYKAKLQPTVAMSSTEAEYMMASDAGGACLYVRSILWDLNVPQDAATFLYEDNDAATAMANAGKPTPRSRHMDIKYYALQQWCEQDLLVEHGRSSLQAIAKNPLLSAQGLLHGICSTYIFSKIQ